MGRQALQRKQAPQTTPIQRTCLSAFPNSNSSSPQVTVIVEMAWGVRFRNAETDGKAMRVSEQVILGPGREVGEMFFHSFPISLPLQDPRTQAQVPIWPGSTQERGNPVKCVKTIVLIKTCSIQTLPHSEKAISNYFR